MESNNRGYSLYRDDCCQEELQGWDYVSLALDGGQVANIRECASRKGNTSQSLEAGTRKAGVIERIALHINQGGWCTCCRTQFAHSDVLIRKASFEGCTL